MLTYTGTGSNATVGHGLSQTPEHIILKRRDGSGWSWYGYNETTGNTKSIYLNSNAAPDTSSTFWNDTSPTASVFTVGTANGINQSSGTYVAYCFHSVDGYSKVGSYTGNGAADGPFIYTGFNPELVILKNTAASEEWMLLDGKIPTSGTGGAGNPRNEYLHPNSNAKQNGPSDGGPFELVDFVSNGFKFKRSTAAFNQNATTMIYIAFAKNPFKTSNAR